MQIHRLYAQICVAVFASLLLFALIAGGLWKIWGMDRYELELFDKTSALASLLLPPAAAPADTHQVAVAHLAETLDFAITVWGPEGRLLAASHDPTPGPDLPIERGAWLASEGDTRWSTRMQDDRLLVLEVQSPFPAIGESGTIIVSLLLLASFIALVMYPYIRRLTRRLERLQVEVERIGSGYLGARVKVLGNDEIGRLAASFNEAANHIEELVTAQRMLLANTSHELRTPLARIRLGIEMWGSGDTSRRAVLEQDIQELDSLVGELLLLARLDTGLATASFEPFEPVDLVGLVAEECVRYDNVGVWGSAGDILGDRRMLQHLVRNLLDNATKHGRPPIEVRVHQLGRTVVELVVADAGDGIPLAEQEKVTQPFYRLAGKQDTPGSGLGLALVERIARAHHGHLTFHDNPSEVIVSFPILPTDH